KTQTPSGPRDRLGQKAAAWRHADNRLAAGGDYQKGLIHAERRPPMITLYGFGPYLGMPDGSPFVMKGEVLLRMAGLAYTKSIAPGGPDQGPKGKLPYIDDAGEIVADTTFIRAHVARKYGFDFDRGLDAGERAEAWAIERMIEDHLYWCCLHMRWGIDENFENGPAHFFDKAPEAIRDKIREGAR